MIGKSDNVESRFASNHRSADAPHVSFAGELVIILLFELPTTNDGLHHLNGHCHDSPPHVSYPARIYGTYIDIECAL